MNTFDAVLRGMCGFPTSGLQHYWSFDKNDNLVTYDAVGGANGTANNVRVYGESGKKGFGADFTKGNDYINVGLRDISTYKQITFSFWAKDWYVDGNLIAVTGGEVPAPFIWGIYFDHRNSGCNLTFIKRTSSTPSERVIIKNNLDPNLSNSWNLFTIVVDFENLTIGKIYLNGIDSNNQIDVFDTTTFPSFVRDNYLGAYRAGGNVLWYNTGSMDEIGIWNRVLTEEEVKCLYNYGNGKFYK